MIAATAAPDRAMTILYALGWTQHSVRAADDPLRRRWCSCCSATSASPGGGMNALRGHSNIQGLTDLGLLSNLLPGYLTLPSEKEQDYDKLHRDAHAEAAAPEPAELLAELPQVPRQPDEGLVGRCGHDGQQLGLRLAAQARQAVRRAAGVRGLMHQGKINGYICQGFNPLAAVPEQGEDDRRRWPSSSSWSSSIRWRPRPRSSGATSASTTTSTPRKIQTEVFRLPSTCFAEEDGSLVNSRPLAAVALERRRAAGRGARRPRDHGAACSRACARCTRRKAARSPIRSSS